MSKHNKSGLQFLEGGGEMGALIRAYDWSDNPVGPPENWPQSLRVTIRLMLTTNHPMMIFWGPDLIQFYNDAFARTIGPDRHPRALGQSGRECWQEVWHIVGAQIEQVSAGKGTIWQEHAYVPITRNGRLEDVWWTYSYSPIDLEDRVGGVLVVCNDVTEQHLTTERLRESEAAIKAANERLLGETGFLRELFRQAPSFMAVLRGPEHVYELVNAPYVRLIGGRDIVGKPIRTALPELVGQGFIELLDRVYATGEPYSDRGVRVSLLSAEGTLEDRYVDYVFQPIRSAEAEVSGIFIEGVDVTDHILGQERLRIAQRAGKIGAYEWFPQKGGRVEVSEEFRRIWGVPADAPLTDRYLSRHVYPGDRREQIASGSNPEVAMGYAEYRIIRPDTGELRWIARRGEVVREEGQAQPRYVGVIWDITERMAAEDKLRQLNETLEQRVDEALAERKLWAEVFEHTDAFICVLDRGYNWLAVNRAYADEFERIYGMRPKAGDNILAALRHMPEHRKDVRAVWDRALAGEEFTIIDAFGDVSRARVPYELTYKALHDREGNMIGAYQFAQSLADRLKHQAQLAEALAALKPTGLFGDALAPPQGTSPP